MLLSRERKDAKTEFSCVPQRNSPLFKQKYVPQKLASCETRLCGSAKRFSLPRTKYTALDVANIKQSTV
jgi:hypothetical protein